MANTTSNKITYGLRNLCYFKATITDGEITYSAPVKLEGAQEMTATILGGKTDIYADDKVFATINGASGQELTFTLTDLPESFLTDILGYQKSSDGNLLEIVDAPVVSFALGFEIQGDSSERRVVYPLCVATPFAQGASTKSDSISINTISLTVTARPVEVDGNYMIRQVVNKNDTNYSTLFTTAYTLPTTTL